MHARPAARPWRSVLAIVGIGTLLGCGATPSATAPATTAVAVPGSPEASVPASVGSPASSVATTSQAAGRATTSPAAPSVAPSRAGHVWWIVLENHEYGSIIGSRAAPYINGLAVRYGLATRYYATSHPSEPNYVALVAGSTLGVTSDGIYRLDRPSLFSQLANAGRSWRVYAQNDRTGCYTGVSARGGLDGPGTAGTYVRKHNPAISFTSVARDPAQCRNIRPLRAFDPQAAPFEMIVPNLTNDMHDGTIAEGDAFLRALVPHILASAAFRAGGVLFITFDEGSSSRGSLGDHGGHVVTLIVSTSVPRGRRYRAYADHFSLLRTTERILGLPCLAGACRRSPIF